MHRTSSGLVALLLLTLSQLLMQVSAHMTMATPLAFFPNPDHAKTPLTGPGGEFPCKTGISGLSLASSVATTTYEAGKEMSVTLAGGATHGGGSCQFSLSYDGGKSWGVVYSVIGGCLATTLTYSFKLPAELPGTDSALFAWTWINYMGGAPEIYMNCAPVKIKSSAKGSLTVPALFKANLGEGCTSIGNCDVKYPKPGKWVLAGQTKCNAGASSPGYTGTCKQDPDVTFQANGKGGGKSGSGGMPSVSPGKYPLSQAVALHAAPSAAASEQASDSPESGPSQQTGGDATSAASDAASDPAPVVFKGDPQTGLDEVNFVAKNKEEAEAEYSLGAQGQGDEEETVSTQSDSQEVSNPSEVPAVGLNAVQSVGSSPVVPPSGSSTGQLKGSCTGILGCSDDGKSFFLCGQSGWIPMGSVAAGTACRNGVIGYANMRRRATKAPICEPSDIACSQDGLQYSICLAEGVGYAPAQPVPYGHTCQRGSLIQDSDAPLSVKRQGMSGHPLGKSRQRSKTFKLW
ncbi:lytic polysaccharide monooxygenase [Cystobasidium minutum MCA 4210]|uniref:lytic polysaccharide monooxygenase n=1 Tax=Cystobasidium minutum MCA 4210 TaxID=1397322 RepID=UPI0034CF54D3|eukprot:jgi/Rhomi1/212575/estExt_Genemark1.C_70063